MGAFLSISGSSIAAEATDGATKSSADKPVTFAKDVAPILQAKCEECHHKGTAAPMSLVTYEETRPWAKSIRERVITRNMPPWHIDKTVGIRHFANDRSLSDEQIATIVRWVDSGAPLGDPKDLPLPNSGRPVKAGRRPSCSASRILWSSRQTIPCRPTVRTCGGNRLARCR